MDSLLENLPEEFPNYETAEEFMLNFTTILGDAGEPRSAEVLNSTLTFFNELLVRNPLMNATADNARSFLNVSTLKKKIRDERVCT